MLEKEILVQHVKAVGTVVALAFVFLITLGIIVFGEGADGGAPFVLVLPVVTGGLAYASTRGVGKHKIVPLSLFIALLSFFLFRFLTSPRPVFILGNHKLEVVGSMMVGLTVGGLVGLWRPNKRER